MFESIDDALLLVDCRRDRTGSVEHVTVLEANAAARRRWPAPALADGDALLAEFGVDWRDMVRSVLDSGTPAHVEAEDRSTPLHWSRCRLTRVGGPGSTLVAVTVIDITERKRAEIALRAKEERQALLLTLSDTLRAIDDPLAIQETACRIVGKHLGAARAAYGELDGDGRHLVVGQGWIRDRSARPSGRFVLDDYGQRFAAAVRAGRTVAIDPTADEAGTPGDAARRWQALDGRAVLASSLRGRGGRVACFLVLDSAPRRWSDAEAALVAEAVERTWEALARARAVAAERESEEQQRLTLALVPALLWWADPAGVEIARNDQWNSYTGQDDAAVRDHGWLDAIHPDDRPATEAAFVHAFATGEPLERQQRIRRGDGVYRWHLVRHVPIRDDGAIVRWFGAAIDIDDLHRVQEHQKLLLAELQHRVRNILTVVRSIFGRTLEAGGDPHDFADHFRGRLDSLARTQVLMTQGPTAMVDLEDLVRDELMSVGVTDGPDVVIDGPEVALDPATAESIGLAIHELTTNALKFGALEVASGRLDIRWVANLRYGEGRYLDFRWTEQGVPAVPLDPEHVGFGSELITEALPYRLGAETRLDFRGGGVRCSISVPLTGPGVRAASAWKET